MKKEVEKLIQDIIIGAEFAGGNPDIGDWVEEIYILAGVSKEQEAVCKSCGLAPCKCDYLEDKRKYGDPMSWYTDEGKDW
jgi:hypothetical protein